jgi:hypothetical protein
MTTVTTRLAAVALTVLASAALLVGAVGPAQPSGPASIVRTFA